MRDITIRAENLSKRYRIGIAEQAPKTLRQAALGFAISPFQYVRNVLREPSPDELIWALKDVSFEIERGEVIGVIGRNGAGKSTLLKILSRITEPSGGYAEIRGRVASLLEVGTGFNPELTGRENIYLNGTIMGMKKREIDQRFDEIVAFAEVEKFIDTPVKRYSSGMHVRLAFAVAAHLEPEILIVDEVLAVGDFMFQKKCLAKVKNVSASQGRTVLFVSHSMTSLLALCDRSIYLKKGEIVGEGSTSDIVNQYLDDYKSQSDLPLAQRQDREGSSEIIVTDLKFFNPSTSLPLDTLVNGQDLSIEIAYRVQNPAAVGLRNLVIGIDFFNALGQFIMVLKSDMASQAFTDLEPEGRVYCCVPQLPLMNGSYYINVSLYTAGILVDKVGYAKTFEVEGDFFGYGIQDEYARQGVYVPHYWGKTI